MAGAVISMPLPSPVPLSFFLLVTGVVFGLAGLVWLLPYSVPTPDTWVTVLLLLSITLGTTGIGGVTLEPGLEYKYAGYSTGDCSDETYVYEYTELSPEKQEVFDSTIEDSPYITRTYRGFVVETDAGQRNCIKKGSQYYRLTVQKIGPYGLGHAILYMGMIVAAAILSFIILPVGLILTRLKMQ